MEQRIEQAVPLIKAAGTDPAFVPGITPPPGERPVEEPSEGAVTAAPAEVDDEAPAARRQDVEQDVEEDEEAAWETTDGAFFEAFDQEGSVTANRAGVRFRLAGEEARFPWSEIGAVEIATPSRFGRRLGVTVYTTDRRRYEAEVTAPARDRLKQWNDELDAVLDAYFEES